MFSLQINDTINSNSIESSNSQLSIFFVAVITTVIILLIVDFVFSLYIFRDSETKSKKTDYPALDLNNIDLLTKKDNSIKKDTIDKEAIKIQIPKSNVKKEIALKKIGYIPNESFNQDEPYSYPVVKFPNKDSIIKFPKNGRSNKKGYKEDDFLIYLKKYFSNDFSVFNDKHISQKNAIHKPYEPDFILCTEINNKNIFINIEIDEPYDGVTRTPTHIVNQDIYRDLFFTNRGYIVIRFTEKQIHEQPLQCCKHIAKVIYSIDTNFKFQISESIDDINFEPQWDSLQAKKWAKDKYRENYLGIEFGLREQLKDVISSFNTAEDEIIESLIKSNTTKVTHTQKAHLELQNSHPRDTRITFNQKNHIYQIDNNPDTISVSQLIDRFFPEFDSYTAASRLNPSHELFGLDVDVIVETWRQNAMEQANLGTRLHNEIENFYNQREYDNSQIEFEYFQNFLAAYPNMKPYRTEWRIFDEELMIAGTVDMVYKRPNGDFYIFDWKRSKNVVNPDDTIKLSDPNNAFTEFAFGELNHLTNDSYNKYLLQQNIYRHILESKYNLRISSMNLLILHPKYDRYHLVKLPRLEREIEYIFNTSRIIT